MYIKHNSTKKAPRKSLFIKESEETIDLILSHEFMAQAYRLHSQFPKGIEFCGILIYEQEDDNTLIAHGIYPVNLGSSGFTEGLYAEYLPEVSFMYPKIIDEKNPWKVGMIHTHHSMETYFSGEDLDELKQNSKFHKFYLSLIINYRGDFSAKVSIHTSMKSEYTVTNISGKSQKVTSEEEFLYVYNCNILYERNYEEFEDAVDRCIKEYETVGKKRKNKKGYYNYYDKSNGYKENKDWYIDSKQDSLFSSPDSNSDILEETVLSKLMLRNNNYKSGFLTALEVLGNIHKNKKGAEIYNEKIKRDALTQYKELKKIYKDDLKASNILAYLNYFIETSPEFGNNSTLLLLREIFASLLNTTSLKYLPQ